MVLVKIVKSWQIPENQVTPETIYFNRRRFLKTAVGFTIGAGLTSIVGCQKSQVDPLLKASLDLPKIRNIQTNPNFAQEDRPITNEILAGQHNNFYEFGGSINIWRNAQQLPLENWKVEVTGLVKNPQIYDIDDLKKQFPLEERIYRFRCVEAWSMVLPWIGFPMQALMAKVEPKSEAKFVRFTSFYDPKITDKYHNRQRPWPYQEGLTIAEMANELAFFAIGIYGHDLPKQHGAPLRMVTPWKYGFKGAKSIVKIEFIESQPATFWNTLKPKEYDFESNVNPYKPHRRWSQATERLLGSESEWSWETKPTLIYNGYGEYVASLYR
jgi:sulfoxide reductase catalytic subunit YedY